MEQWLIDIDTELRRARGTAHEGKRRASARRIAGIALAAYARTFIGAAGVESYIVLLDECAADASRPDAVRDAARRLEARVGADFSSPSTDPLGDAEIIVNFVRSALQRG